jgi:plastocyanin
VRTFGTVLLLNPPPSYRRPQLGLCSALAAGILLARSPAPAVTAMGAPSAREAVSPRATGRIAGTVEISTALSTRRPRFRIYSEPGSGAVPPSEPSAREAAAAELHNVEVYLEGDSAAVPASTARGLTRPASMAQRDEHFVRHVLPVVPGSTVDVPNEEDVYHNVFSLSAAAGPDGFDLGRYPRGSSRSITFSRPGTVQVFCHIHSDMNAIVLVLSNPFFASPDADHHFVIEDVPEGDYTIVGWHERIKPIVRHIHVTAGQTTSADFNIPLPQGGPSAP